MPRLPFSNDESSTDKVHAMTVSEFTERVKVVLAGGFPAKIRIAGEISNLSDRSHWFFSLKDEGAAVRCVCFASTASRIRFKVRDGMAVVVTARVDYYAQQGNLQIYVDRIEPIGEGELELRFRQLCEELRGLGYFDQEHKKPLPPMPEKVAVVTSRSAAALQDVINTVHRRWHGCRLYLYDVRVQGEQAASEIADAIDRLSMNGRKLGIEVIILTRGGGSIEDLWAFNERTVADALFDCSLPVVAAIGHETDTTVAELVADVRCSTPTQAAMTLVPDRASLEHQVMQLSHRLSLLARRRVDGERQRWRATANHPAMKRPERMLEPVRLRLDELTRRLHMAGPQMVAASRQKWENLTRQLASIGPQNVLQRGYSYTLGPDGRVLRGPQDVKAGDTIRTVLAKGEVASVVGDDAGTINPGKKSAKKSTKRSRKKPTNQTGLFS